MCTEDQYRSKPNPSGPDVMFGLDGYHFKGVITRFRTTGHVLFRGEFSLEGV